MRGKRRRGSFISSVQNPQFRRLFLKNWLLVICSVILPLLVCSIISQSISTKNLMQELDTSSQRSVRNTRATLQSLLDEAVELWKFYMQACLYPDRKYSPKHALRIANSLKTICQSMFAACEEKQAPHLLAPLLAALEAPDVTADINIHILGAVLG